MVVAKLTKQQVIGALRGTGSSDVDVLFSKKEELLAETKKMKLLGIMPWIVGGAMSLTIIGAVVGIPIMFFGWYVGKTLKNNIQIADAAYAEYVASIRPSLNAVETPTLVGI